MRTLAVWILDDASGADRAADVLARFARHQAAGVDDAAAAWWVAGAPGPGVRRLSGPLSPDPAGDLFWGTLLGIALLPRFGTATRPDGALTGIGIPDDLVARTGTALRPGTSALLVLADGTAVGRLHDALAAYRPTLLYTNLSPAHDELLRTAFPPST
ncbi:hypothetical protein Val02_47760 [Virgisporangium aliadipatigenens]|uniref:Uncharacterized protein n=1 Tax=Virgisporangium aliadipatigenens TaxID=741659 RepID=A0A8J4DR92_9ACTN|nr:DUF1269 domain-containing protein [Virgisporangium aliadipatigenens]GIJ47890.1 hypothetical protein Val02_47760 [Virgisporangium aliadipatigenens]